MSVEHSVSFIVSLSIFRRISLLLEYPDQCESLILLIRICQQTVTRQHLLQYAQFDRVHFGNFVYVKPLNEGRSMDVLKKV